MLPFVWHIKGLSAAAHRQIAESLQDKNKKSEMAFLQLSRQNWVGMWGKWVRGAIDYNMHDLFCHAA